MRVLLQHEWRDGFLDYYRSPQEYRIQVLAWENQERLEGLYFVRPRELRLLWNYLREIGLIQTLRKIASRSQERYRNEKFASFGLGRVIESADESRFSPGQAVAFLAPSHPLCVDRIVLPGELMTEISLSDLPPLPSGQIVYWPASRDHERTGPLWEGLRGWSGYSGRALSTETTAEMLRRSWNALRSLDWQNARHLPSDEQCRVTEMREPSRPKRSGARHRAVLFGYGNYAKTIILPNVRPYLAVDCIHEIDPTQIPQGPGDGMRWDTSPVPRPGEACDAFLIAGFHHTHAALAIHALQHDACAVVEKPIVTNGAQLDGLLRAMQASRGRLFSCFHKRYLALNQWAAEDMQLRSGVPVSYHCIVYEVPLPALHWYRWPSSRSRLVSNGCHWLDHFLWLNDFAEPQSMELFVAKDGTLNCSVELENGAVFSMTLTDRGSDRIGVQEFVELRAEGVTVRMTNGADYVAEDGRRIIRCKRINKLQCYKTMYQHIGRSIIDGSAGDSLRSVRVSAGLTLALEERLERLVSKTSHPRRSGSAEEIPGETVRRRARRPAAASSVVQAGPDLARGRRQPE